MASRRPGRPREKKRPPLQLQFTVQGGKRVLPLTEENVAAVFKTGVLTKRDQTVRWRTFGQWLGIPESIKDPLSAAAWWVGRGRVPQWRAIIYWLDMVGETGLADQLMPYCEPPSDSSLTVERMTPVFMNIRDWTTLSGGSLFSTIVPAARAEVIRGHYKSEQDQRQQGALYYVDVYFRASWGNLAKILYRAGEKRAIEAFKAQLPKPKDPTLTVEAMMTVTKGVTLPERSYSHYLDMPFISYYDIVSRKGTGEEGRRELLSAFLSHHPYPRWEVVIKLLEDLEKIEMARAGLAQEVKEKYVTSVRSLFTLCVGHIVNNYEFYQPLLPQLLPHHIHTHITSLPAWQQEEEEEESLMLKRQKVCV